MNTYSRPLTLSEESRRDYAGLYLLDLMVSESKVFSLLPSKDSSEADLSPILERLLYRGEVELYDHEFYRATQKGKKRLEDFINLYDEHLDYLDYLSAVDLELLEFAYASAHVIEDDDEWEEFLYDERFSDLRLAYCEYHSLNPLEALFYSYWCDENFAISGETWNIKDLTENVWDDIGEILKSSSPLAELTYHDDSGNSITAMQVMGSLIEQVDLFLQGLDLEDDLEVFTDSPRDGRDSDEEGSLLEKLPPKTTSPH